MSPPLVFDLSVRSIVSPFVFLMPTAGAVLELDRDALPWRPLLLRCSFRGRVSGSAGGKRLRKDVADFVGPTPVVLDDRESNMAHSPNFLLIALADTANGSRPSGDFVAVLQWGVARSRRTARPIAPRIFSVRPLSSIRSGEWTSPGPTADF